MSFARAPCFAHPGGSYRRARRSRPAVLIAATPDPLMSCHWQYGTEASAITKLVGWTLTRKAVYSVPAGSCNAAYRPRLGRGGESVNCADQSITSHRAAPTSMIFSILPCVPIRPELAMIVWSAPRTG